MLLVQVLLPAFEYWVHLCWAGADGVWLAWELLIPVFWNVHATPAVKWSATLVVVLVLLCTE
jgi:hypothetical protein